MSNETFPITPPPELFKQWEDDILNERDNVDYVLDCAWRNGFQAGADQELEACCAWFQEFYKTESWVKHDLKHFRAARRPKSPSLKEQALKALQSISSGAVDGGKYMEIMSILQKAIEQLPDTH
jgi:hypothetical protein